MSPQRIQLRRTKGWRKPAGAVVVSRPSRWGNPIKIGDTIEGRFADRAGIVRGYRLWLAAFHQPLLREAMDNELRGRDLACWCPLDQPCHADVLLEVANAPSSGIAPPGSVPTREATEDAEDFTRIAALAPIQRPRVADELRPQ